MVNGIGSPGSPKKSGGITLSISGELRLYDVAFGTRNGKRTLTVTILGSKRGDEVGRVFQGDQLVTIADGDGRAVLCLTAHGEIVLRLEDIRSSPASLS